MDIIAAAALIAVGIVAAAVVYAIVNGRLHGARHGDSDVAVGRHDDAAEPGAPDRAAALARREETLATARVRARARTRGAGRRPARS